MQVQDCGEEKKKDSYKNLKITKAAPQTAVMGLSSTMIQRIKTPEY